MSAPLSSSSCSASARAAGEPLAGTAPEVARWIGLEHRAPWSARGFPEVDLPAVALDCLRRQRAQGARIQLLRQPQRRDGPLRLLLSDGTPRASWAFDLDRAEDLAALPWADLWAGQGPSADRLSAPTLLVCTHGRRDRCCAIAGTAAYLALSADARAEVWQTTHLGGHRFAATLVSLPDGLCYGRLDPADAPALLDALAAGQAPPLHLWRGRCAWPPPAQAAEIHQRQQQQQQGAPLSLSALQLRACIATAEDVAWQVHLKREEEDVVVMVERVTLPAAIRKSCTDEALSTTSWLRVVTGEVPWGPKPTALSP